jgi:hypothetical protein
MYKNSMSLGLILVVAALTGCSKTAQPYNVEHRMMPGCARDMTSSELEKAIIRVAEQRGWQCQRYNANTIICQMNKRGQSARVSIEYTRQEFSIRTLSTSSGKGAQKHANKWMRALEKDIVTEVRKTNGRFRN